MNFIDYIENLYQSLNIYRAIIISNKNLFNIKKELINNNHLPIIINNNSYINYDYRLFLINDIKLLSKFKKDSYNIIIIY